MSCKYENILALLPGYFNQDFDLDFDNPYDAVDFIIAKNINNPRLALIALEIDSIIDNKEVLDENFFYKLDFETVPFDDVLRNREFLLYLRDKILCSLDKKSPDPSDH